MYLRRQQEMGLMQKTRCLMDENDVSFHMSFITIASKSRISVFKQCQSNSQISVSFVVVFLGGGGWWGEHAQKPKFQVVSSVKKEFIRHFARLNFSRLS